MNISGLIYFVAVVGTGVTVILAIIISEFLNSQKYKKETKEILRSLQSLKFYKETKK